MQLLYGVAVAILFSAARGAYSVGSLIIKVDGKPSTLPTSLATKAILSVVPEINLTFILCVVGIATRNIPGAFWTVRRRRGPSGLNVGLESFGDRSRLANDGSQPVERTRAKYTGKYMIKETIGSAGFMGMQSLEGHLGGSGPNEVECFGHIWDNQSRHRNL